MRILVYPHSMEIGGSQLNAIELAAAVRDRGHDVLIFALEDGPLVNVATDLRLPVVMAPAHTKRPSLLVVRALGDLCRQRGIHIVHGYEWPPAVEGFYGPLLAHGVRVGCTVMSMAVAPFIPQSVSLVVGTEQIAAATRKARRSRVDVIEPPVDVNANHPRVDGSSFRAQYGLDARPVVVLVSRLAINLKLEGIERAINAAGDLACETDLRLVIVGDGPARERVARLADEVNARAGGDRVILTGELADPRPAYAAADVVLGMGGSALRAMAFAKPVVILGERGFAELLTPETAPTFLWQGFYGLGSGPEHSSSLTQMLRALLSDPTARQRLGAFARRLVEERFALTRAAERQISLYEQWLSVEPRRAILLKESAVTAAHLLRYKVRRKLDRWRRRNASEDFNTVKEIAKVMAFARQQASFGDTPEAKPL